MFGGEWTHRRRDLTGHHSPWSSSEPLLDDQHDEDVRRKLGFVNPYPIR